MLTSATGGRTDTQTLGGEATRGVGGPRPAEYIVTLSLLAFSFMLFQISVLRELRYALSPMLFTLTPFVFSTVIFFIGLGSCAAGLIPKGTRVVLRWSVFLLPIALLPFFAATVALSQHTVDHTMIVAPSELPEAQKGGDYIGAIAGAFVIVAVFGYGPVFFLQGLIFSLYFCEGRDEGTLSGLYAADLMASGVAALLGGVLALYANPVGCVLIAAGVLVITLWLARRYLQLSLRATAIVTLVAIAMIGAELATGVLAGLDAPTWLPAPPSFSTWTPYRRIDAIETKEQLTVYTDGLPFQAYDKADRTHLRDQRVIASLLSESDAGVNRILIIGAGSGADIRILRDRIARPLEITAVELDGGFVRTAQTFPWLWAPYRTARVFVEEGRYFLEKTRDVFDLIVYAYIDPQSAISTIGIPDANFLYTDRAIRKAYARLRTGGYLVITRVYLVDQEAEFFSQLSATLQSAGIPRSEVAIFRSTESVPWGWYGRFASASVILRKGGPAPAVSSDLLVPMSPFDGGRPSTDLYPLSTVTAGWLETLWTYIKGRTGVLAILVVLMLALAGRLATSLGHAHFFLLGLASFLLESLVLLNSFLLFGNPSLSAALAIGCFLLWSGVGSQFSERLQAWRDFYWFVPIAVLFYALTGPLVHAATMGTSVAVRSAVFAVHLVPAGLVVGALFPISLRSFSRQNVASMFFIDLVGCAVAPILFWFMMSVQGILAVAAVSVGGYGAVAIILARRA